MARCRQKPSKVDLLQPRAVAVDLAGKCLRGTLLLLLLLGLATSPALGSLSAAPVVAARQTDTFPGEPYLLSRYANGLRSIALRCGHCTVNPVHFGPRTSETPWDHYLATEEGGSETNLEAVASAWSVWPLTARRNLAQALRPRSDRLPQRIYLLNKSLLH